MLPATEQRKPCSATAALLSLSADLSVLSIARMTYFCEMRYLLSLIAALMLMSGCRKTEDITATMQPAIDNATAFQAVAAHTFIPIAEVLRDWGNSRATIPTLVLTDSGIWFDYKSNTNCADGLSRKGKCLIKNGFSGSGFMDTCIMTARPEDSFAIIGSKGPVYFTGQLKFTTVSYYEIALEGNAEIRINEKKYSIDLDGILKLDPEGQTARNAKFKTGWSAKSRIEGGEVFHYEVSRDGNCFPCFSLGKGYNSSKNTQINFNPFSNGACDPVVKFTSGREEWLTDLW